MTTGVYRGEVPFTDWLREGSPKRWASLPVLENLAVGVWLEQPGLPDSEVGELVKERAIARHLSYEPWAVHQAVQRAAVRRRSR